MSAGLYPAGQPDRAVAGGALQSGYHRCGIARMVGCDGKDHAADDGWDTETGYHLVVEYGGGLCKVGWCGTAGRRGSLYGEIHGYAWLL